jgi:hypothetical protein
MRSDPDAHNGLRARLYRRLGDEQFHRGVTVSSLGVYAVTDTDQGLPVKGRRILPSRGRSNFPTRLRRVVVV